MVCELKVMVYPPSKMFFPNSLLPENCQTFNSNETHPIDFMKRWQFWVGVLISAVFLWWTLHTLNPADCGRQSSMPTIGGFARICCVFCCGMGASVRWHYLLRPIKEIKTRTMFRSPALATWVTTFIQRVLARCSGRLCLNAEKACDLSFVGYYNCRAHLRRCSHACLCPFQPDTAENLAQVIIRWEMACIIQELVIWGVQPFRCFTVFPTSGHVPTRNGALVQWFIDRCFPFVCVSKPRESCIASWMGWNR